MFNSGKIKKLTPIQIRRETDFGYLQFNNPCNKIIHLGSFWTGVSSGFESQVVKIFKNCYPSSQFLPHLNELIDFYIDNIISKLKEVRIDGVVRVLSSSEANIDIEKPGSLLIDRLYKILKADNLSWIFFRSQPRPPLRSIGRMSGPCALKQRLYYAAEDLFIKPICLKGRILLFDDIYNTGASVRVYSNALKVWCGVDEVLSVNLAATRFNSGKDGLGYLRLDKGKLDKYSNLKTCVVSENLIHKNKQCSLINYKGIEMFEFFAKKFFSKCTYCS